MGSRITMLLVDDSSLARKGLRTLLEQHDDFEIVGEATTGKEAVVMAAELQPRVVTMDLDMPEMNGLEAIEAIMADYPTRILVVTGVPRFDGRDATFEALSRGALELLPKTSHWPGDELEQWTLIKTLRGLADVPVVPHVGAHRKRRRQDRRREPFLPAAEPRGADHGIVVIGASTGGPSVLCEMVAGLGEDLKVPVVICQHLGAAFADAFVDWLATYAKMPVVTAKIGDAPVAGAIFVVAGDRALGFDANGCFTPDSSHRTEGSSSNIDVLFASASTAFGRGAVGVLLTGMGADGARGLQKIAEHGGVTVAQDEASSSVFGMPKAAIDLGCVQNVLSPEAIASLIHRMFET